MKGIFSRRLFKLPAYIRPYPFVHLLINLAAGIIAPLFVLFLRSRNITLLEIGILSSVFEICISLFEIPTGYIADKLGRKISVLCCFLCFTIAGIFYAVTDSYSGFIFASGIQGIGYTFVSGALQAWCVDTIKHHGDESMIKYTLVSGSQARRAGLLVGSVFGGYIGTVKMGLVWSIYITINIIGFIYTLLFMKEYRFVKAKCDVNDSRARKLSIADILINSSKYILITAAALFTIAIIYEFALSPVEEYWTVHLSEQLHIGDSILGWLITISNLLLVISIKPIVIFFDKKIDNLKMLILTKSLVAISIALFGFASKPILAVAAFLSYKFFSGICEPITETFLNSLINDKYRATILSVYSMAGSAGEIISGVLAGFIAYRFGISYAFYLGSVSIILTLIIYIYIKILEKRMHKSKTLSA